MRVIDCTIYSGEYDLLNARLNYLDEFIDKFIIVEATENFSGTLRLLDEHSRDKIIDRFPRKIQWEILNFPNFVKTPWEREAYQRNYLQVLLANNHTADLILLSDIDEIPSASFIETSKSRYPNFSIAEQSLYQYCIHNKNRNSWHGTIAFNVLSQSLTPQELRLKSVKYWENVENVVGGGGWHFSSFGSFKDKIQKFSHQELNTWPYTTNWLFSLMRNFGISVLGNQEIDLMSDETLPIQITCHYRHSTFGRKLLTPLAAGVIKLIFRIRVKELSMPKDF
jgi:hypothetical protein